MAKLIRVTTVPLALKTLLRGQMQFMNQEGFDVIMVSADSEDRNAVVDYEKCPHVIVSMTRAITPIKDFKSLIQLIRLFKKEKPDIVHSHTPKAGLLAMLAAKYTKVPVRIHTIAGLRFMTAKGVSKQIMIAMEKLTCWAAQHVWPNSFSMQDYVLKKKLCKPAKLEVIGNGSSNGIDLTRFNASALKPEKIEGIKKKINYDASLFYFLFVGRLVKDKGIEELIRAFENIYSVNKNTRLVLVGNLESELDPINIRELNILQSHDGIISVGWDSNVEYYFNLCNLFVFPSHREGFPNVLLQAGAMNCPVVCSNIPGNIDIVQHEQTGLLFKVNDQKELETAMLTGMNNDEKREQYRKTLFEKVSNQFSQIFVHRKIAEKYRQYLPALKPINEKL
jgi:glycosyltransferase involved in cell wall biosynthesis